MTRTPTAEWNSTEFLINALTHFGWRAGLPA